MLIHMSLAHALTLHAFVTASALLLYVVTSHAARQRRNPAAAISWILFILLLPYAALPLYLAFGTRKSLRGRLALPRPGATTSGRWAVDAILAVGQPVPAHYSDLRIHADGRQAQEALLEIIDGAQRSIDICTFIIGRDSLGSAVMERLCAKSRSGVRVRLLLDGLGHLMAGRPDLSPLREAGVACTLFMPPWRAMFRGRANMRIHRKLLLADSGLDAGRLWCGGRNLATEYFLGEPGAPAWRDLSFDLRGALLAHASVLFELDWGLATGAPPSAGRPPQAPGGAIGGAQLVASGADQPDDTVYSVLLAAAYRAEHRIALATPYFVPDAALLLALCMAARRGVKVDLLMPRRSNHALSDAVRGRSLRALTQAGASVWLAPGMIHAKLVVIDDALALAGSANLDSRSLFLNYELMVAFHAAQDIQRFGHWFDAQRDAAHRFTPQAPGLLRDIVEGMLLWAAFQL